MNEWMDGCMYVWMGQWVDGRMDGWTDVCMHGWVSGWIDGRMDVWMGQRVDGRMDGQTDGLPLRTWQGANSNSRGEDRVSSSDKFRVFVSCRTKSSCWLAAGEQRHWTSRTFPPSLSLSLSSIFPFFFVIVSLRPRWRHNQLGQLPPLSREAVSFCACRHEAFHLRLSASPRLSAAPDQHHT